MLLKFFIYDIGSSCSYSNVFSICVDFYAAPGLWPIQNQGRRRRPATLLWTGCRLASQPAEDPALPPTTKKLRCCAPAHQHPRPPTADGPAGRGGPERANGVGLGQAETAGSSNRCPTWQIRANTANFVAKSLPIGILPQEHSTAGANHFPWNWLAWPEPAADKISWAAA